MTVPLSTIAWGHNPGQSHVKDTFEGEAGQKRTSKPYPAVIAPFASSDDIGLGMGGRSTALLEATVAGARYMGGIAAQRSPLAIREMDSSRLNAESPVYPALIQMSFKHTKLNRRGKEGLPRVAIATAMPVGWRDIDGAEAALEQHIRTGLRDLAEITWLEVKSEPAAVVLHEMLNDDGVVRSDQASLSKGLVCVADLGGATMNRSVLDTLQALPGQSKSPLLGSRRAVEQLMTESGMGFVDAEQRLVQAVERPGQDAVADRVLRQYSEAVIADLNTAWSGLRPLAYLFAGGTTRWIENQIMRAYPTARILKDAQQAIATGLYRYAKFKLARSQR